MKIAVVLTLTAVFLALVSACTSTSSSPPTPSSIPTPESTYLPTSPTPTTPLQPAPTLPPATARPILTATSQPTPPPLPTKAPTATPQTTPTQPAPTPTPLYTTPTVVIGPVAFPVEVAVTPEQRRQGLSGRPTLTSRTGMLFVFESPMPLQFWMKRMQFPLDFVWIGADCTIGEITRDVPPPPPGTEDSDLARISPQDDMQYVLEINAGEASGQGLEPGQSVVFAGSIAGRFEC